ncbi:glyoxalase-like protein [Kribbella steppae]|uniref:Glyoxalase-like protein n=1 Tax=Kribbella steppae TaxID=2512223 RepID=A0A4R2HH38_9ACTN|nr:VOC family protein [Kribbella steppae]TCO28146.1 glyoxalase-like protein [Kribbella steppae]
MEAMLDHLVFATRDLAGAVERFAAATGVEPAEGGRHEGRGTRNYLVGLGASSYLEIIGPDVERPGSQPAPFGIDELEGDRLVTWAVRPDNIEAAAAVAKEAGADLGPILPMSRTTPTGEVLSWRLAAKHPAPYDGIVPFLIDWGTSRHPAGSGLPSVELLEFGATHPRPDEVSAVLEALEVALPVVSGAPGLKATVGGPGGTYSLS